MKSPTARVEQRSTAIFEDVIDSVISNVAIFHLRFEADMRQTPAQRCVRHNGEIEANAHISYKLKERKPMEAADRRHWLFKLPTTCAFQGRKDSPVVVAPVPIRKYKRVVQNCSASL